MSLHQHHTGADATATPRLRRLPTPRYEPPYDDELPAAPYRSPGASPASPGGTVVQGTLALAFVLPSGLPAVPEVPALRLAGRSVPEPNAAGAAAGAAGALPDPRPWAGRLVQAVAEVLAGDRPVAQLVRWTSAGVFAHMQRRAQGHTRGGSADGPPRQRPVVRSLHISQPAAGVAEVCAAVQRGSRVMAIALRLDVRGGRWLCTALEVG